MLMRSLRSGNLYVADASAHNLLKVAADGTQTTLASGVNSTSVAVDGSGDVYYSDKNANTITVERHSVRFAGHAGHRVEHPLRLDRR
jgi:hypothetical protein